MKSRPFINSINYWTVIGTNYTLVDTQTRSRFTLTNPTINNLYAKAHKLGLHDFFVLSTCNRIEFYSYTPGDAVQRFIQEELNLRPDELSNYFYSKSGVEAVRHFFRVTSGLDSQIVGDYEISGQVKKAVQSAREAGLINTLTDRISNYAFQASKEIKRKTNLSHGRYSVSYATAELINSLQNTADKKILIVGTGEIGQAMARNLKEYFSQKDLTLTNRTLSHAQQLSEELGVSILPFETFASHLHEFDVVITTAESSRYLINVQDVQQMSSQLFLDLSVPQVIDPLIKSQTTATLYSVDEISDYHNKLVQHRQSEIPKAEQIIDDYIYKFLEWQRVFKNTEIIQNYKSKMTRIFLNADNPFPKIEKTFSGLMAKIKLEGYAGCFVIQTMNQLIDSEE